MIKLIKRDKSKEKIAKNVDKKTINYQIPTNFGIMNENFNDFFL